jgi:EmrB/QacA subfamily drug resistance transporter
MDGNAQKRSVLIIATMTAFLITFMGASINVALPVIGQEFAMDAVLLGWVATIFLLTTAMFIVPFGRIGDIYGRKKIFTYGMSIYTIGSFLSAIAPSPLVLIALRAVHGIGSAMIFGTSMAMLMSVFTAGERGKALGIVVASTYFGLSVGPFLGGVLTHQFGWRSIFLIHAPMGLFVILLVLWKLKSEWAEARGERLDTVGSIIYCLMIAAIMYGFSQLPALVGGWLILLGIVGIIAFVWWETKTEHSVFNMNHFRKNKVFTFSNLAALINYSATFAIMFLLSFYLQYLKGFSPQTAGLILIAQPVVMTIGSPFAGRLSDRIEPGVIASTGMAVLTIGLFLLIFLSEHTSLEFIVAVLILLGIGYALFSSPNTNAVMSSVERKFYGVASGTLGTMRSLGMMFSMGIVMLIFSVYMGRVQITPEYYPVFLKAMKAAFIVFASLCFFGIFASLVRGKVR